MKSYVYMYLWSVRHDDRTTIKDYNFVAEEFYIVTQYNVCPTKMVTWCRARKKSHLVAWDKLDFFAGQFKNFLRFLAQWARV